MEYFCKYYQACLSRPKVVEIIGILKSFEHLCFDRAIDPGASLFEFFVPKDQEPIFLALMDYFAQKGIVTRLQEFPNRLIHENTF